MEVTLSSRARATVIWIGVALLLVVLYLARHALAPFIWAVITAYLFHPIVAFIQRKTRLPKQVVALAFDGGLLQCAQAAFGHRLAVGGGGE